MYDGDYSNYYDEPTPAERDKARRRGCVVAVLYLAIIIAGVLFWVYGTK